METALFTLLVTVAIWRHVRDGARSLLAPVCLALAAMTRPEGWLLAAVLCLDAFRVGTWCAAARYAGVFLALFAPYYAWRLSYYGHLAPNTFYAKVGYTTAQVLRGMGYLKGFLYGSGGWLVAGAMLALFTGIARRTAAVYVFLLAYFSYVVLVGGDVAIFHRFFVPVVPALGALSVAGILCAADRLAFSRRMTDTVGVSLLIVCGATSVPLLRAARNSLPNERFIAALNRGIATFVSQHTAPDEAVATIGIGAVKFYSGRTVIDLVGLTDEHIARRSIPSMGRGLAGHEKYDSQYVLSRRPRYIVITGEHDTSAFPAAADLWKQPLFKRCYVTDEVGYRRIDGCADQN
jgi:arabinofuranosyltransferase